ncbi:AraC family transcriptional regulator [Pediococcus siamensis]|uniref:helix-turn-helix transcriptional regulator n=1 Tax=Pediococcus siamensis TaxID=381829 RepID=UPI0039A3C2C3
MRYSFKVNDRSFPLYVDSIGYNWEQEDIFRPTGYPYVHWLQCVKGTGILHIANQSIFLKPQQGILIAQGIPHSYKTFEGTWKTEFFTFGGSLISEILTSLGFHDYLFLEQPDSNITNFIQKHHEEIENSEPLQLFRASELVYEFLLLLKKYMISNPRNEPVYQDVIEPIISLVQSHYSQELDIKDFAKYSNYSEQYIHEVFRKFVGTTPHQYLLQFRIKKAKEFLMNNPELSVEEIRKKVGFNTSSHFISVFKKMENVTPGKFKHFYGHV